MRTWSRQLEDLTSQVAQLKMDKQELQQRNRILESSLTVNTHHEERLHCNEVWTHPGCIPPQNVLPTLQWHVRFEAKICAQRCVGCTRYNSEAQGESAASLQGCSVAPIAAGKHTVHSTFSKLMLRQHFSAWSDNP